MAQGVAWMARELGVPATIVVPDNASMTKLAAVERLGGRIVRVTWEQVVGGGRRGRRARPRRRRRRLLRPPRPGSARDGGERHDRPRARRGSRRLRRRAHPVGRRRADDRDRERAACAAPGARRSTSASRRPARPFAAAVANGARAGHGRLPTVVHRRRRVGRAAPEDVGARARRSSPTRSRSRSRTRRRACDCCSSARASSARARRRCPSRRRWPGSRERAESSASSRAGTSTPRGSRRFSTAASPTSRSAFARALRRTRARGSRCPRSRA